MRLSSRAALWVLAIALGAANAIVLFGWGPLDPTDTTWLFGDNATYYAGWALYRHDPHVSFPLAWSDRVGYPVGTSIALLDAIPLVAILLRPFSPVLPEPFQYLGLYSALCFVLQAYFGMSLCRRLVPGRPAFAVMGGIFFLLSPPLTQRALGHTALLSHWLILAALDGYLRDPGGKPARWFGRLGIVVAIAAGINAYIAFMCVLVALAGVARLWIEGRWRVTRVALAAVTTVAVLAASLASLGVLVTSDATTYRAAGYGALSMNLNAPVNPARYGSILLPTLRVSHPGQHEGYNYLGIGILALLALGAIRRPAALRALGDRRLVPLVALALVSTALAVSASVTLGASALLTVPLPAPIAATLEGLRASGRLFWPAYYLIVAAALALTHRGWSARAGMVILGVALAVQFADVTPLRTRVRRTLDQRFASPLQSPAWTGLGEKYDNLILVPPYQCGPENGAGGVNSYVWFGQLAARERMRANDYYAARYSRSQLQAHCVDLLRAQLEGPLDPKSAYVATDAVTAIWSLAGLRSHRCERVDGFNLCTPAADGAAATPAPEAPAYPIGRTIDFADPDARRYLAFGWGPYSPDGTWTEGPLALARLGPDAAIDPSLPLILEVHARPFAPTARPIEVDVAVNGRLVDHWIFDRSAPATARQARIPPDVAAARRGLDVELRIRNPEAPSDRSVDPSTRFFGLQVQSLAVHRE